MSNVNINVVETFIQLRRILSDYGRVSIQKQKFVSQLNNINILMKSAKLFDIHPEIYKDLYEAVDRYTTTEIAKQSWISPFQAVQISEKEQIHHIKSISEAGENLTLQSNLPFDTFVLLIHPSINLTPEQTAIRIDRPVYGANVVGYLISNTGYVYEFLKVDIESGSNVVVIEMRSQNKWERPYTLTPWLINGLIDIINHHNTLIVEESYKLSHKTKIKQIAKKNKIRVIPPPYYTVKLKKYTITESIQEVIRSAKTRSKLNYRFDVRGHQRIRMQRGPLPLNEEYAKKLKRRGYQVFTNKPVSFEVFNLLKDRGIKQKDKNEWMAIKISWIKPFIRGPKDKPYIPSIRKLESANG